MAIKEKLKKRIEIEDEMSEADFDQLSFDMEMGCIPIGDTDGAFFTIDDINNSRKLKTAVYPTNINVMSKKSYKIPDLAPDERRILSVDIALMGSSSKQNNDASCIIINSAIPINKTEYKTNIIYLENHEDLVTDELVLIVRKLYSMFKCTDLVVDTAGQGLGVYDGLIKNIIDPETGELYPALSCCNNKEMADRCKIDDAPKVIWSVKASTAFNNEICILLRSGFQNRKINLLVNEFEAEEILKDNIKQFSKLPVEEQLVYQMPYVQTTLLIHELINLQYEVNGTNIKVKEKRSMRKDRYSALAYNYWVQHQLEVNELQKDTGEFDIKSYAEKLRKLQRKPTSY